MTGLALKVTRVEHRVKAREVAEAMGVSPSRIAAIEREAFISAETARRYLEAVTTCSTRRTSGAAIQA